MKISKMENTKDLSVIIVNYKSEHYLERCLSSFYASVSEGITYEVLVVNNYPEESLKKIKASFPEIKIIVNHKNGGFGHGNNFGAQNVSGKYLFLLNPDTEILEGNFISVLNEFEKDATVGALGGRLVSEDNSVQEWRAGKRISFWDLIRNNLQYPSSRHIWESEIKKEAAWVSGTSFFVPRQLFLNLKGFDENIFMYFEDIDLCERMRKEGRKIFYFPDFKVLHKGGGSYVQEGKNWQKQNYYDSMEYYFKKHRPKIEALAVKVIRKIFFN